MDSLPYREKTGPWSGQSSPERRVALSELKPGMVLARDLKSVSGVLLVPATYILTEILIKGLRGRRSDPVERMAYVQSRPGLRENGKRSG